MLTLILLAAAAAPVNLTLLPGDVELRGPRAYQKLVVEATYADGHQKDVTGAARLASADAAIATVDGDAVVRPRADGATTVTATLGARVAKIRVQVRGAADTPAQSFRNHVLQVMTKVGCNSGACHGALAGKNGFKLTLRGYDPELDYQVLTREGLCRRVSRV